MICANSRFLIETYDKKISNIVFFLNYLYSLTSTVYPVIFFVVGDLILVFFSQP